MRLALEPPREPDAELIGLSVGGLAVVGLVVWLQWLQLDLPVSGVHERMPWPCVFCGGTRALRALLAGDPAAAWAFNPLVTAGSLASLLFFAYAALVLALRLPRLRLRLASLTELRVMVGLAFALVLANWAYVWTAGVA